MTNLIIGLVVGIASALALVVMWRMAARLRDEVGSEENRPRDGNPAPDTTDPQPK